MHKEELKRLSESEQRDITKASREGILVNYISDRAMEIQREDDGSIKKIIFTIGGPNVWLDFVDYPGFIISAYMTEQEKSGIPWADWDVIKEELEELYV